MYQITTHELIDDAQDGNKLTALAHRVVFIFQLTPGVR